MSNLIINNGTLVHPNGSLECKNLIIKDGLINSFNNAVIEADTVINAADCYVLPGIIDLHTHGIGYESYYSDSLFEYAKLEASFGCTTFFPTLFCPPEESIQHMLRHRANTDEFTLLPQVEGFRLESPYLAKTGGGISRDLAPISDSLTNSLLTAGGGHIKIWDVSPELDGAAELISYLSGKGIVCTLAHTKADVKLVKAAIDAGAKLVTHLFNTFDTPQITDPGVFPAGITDYLLIDDLIACEIVADGTHVHPFLVEKTLRCKPDDKTIFVTDSNYGAGLPSGNYEMPGSWGTAAINGPNNGVRLVERDFCLAGSALTPIDALRNSVRLFGKDLDAASRLCSANPAKLLGLNKGEISPGKDADLIILDKNLELLHTISMGKVIFSK